MSANAGTWFYRQPESQPFMVTERLNGTFWQARAVEIYWRCVETGAICRAEGYQDGTTRIEMEWEPLKWLRIKAGGDANLKELITIISKKVLMIPASMTYGDSEGNQYVEWRRDGGHARWTEIQGTAGFVNPRRLTHKGD